MTPFSNGAVPLLNNSVSLGGLRLLRERFPKLPADCHKRPQQRAKSWPAALRAACTKSMMQNSVKRTECDKWKTVITCFHYGMPIHMCFPQIKLTVSKVFRVMFTFKCMLGLKLTALLLVPVYKMKIIIIPFHMTRVCHTCMFSIHNNPFAFCKIDLHWLQWF